MLLLILLAAGGNAKSLPALCATLPNTLQSMESWGVINRYSYSSTIVTVPLRVTEEAETQPSKPFIT